MRELMRNKRHTELVEVRPKNNSSCESNNWYTQDSYMRWLYSAYEHLKRSKYVYDKRQRRIYYNKPYWEWRFKMEIKRMERIILLEQRIKMECDCLV